MRSLLSRWWSEVRRYLACSPWLVALALCLPAGAQPTFTGMTELLASLRCSTACVCFPTCPQKQCGRFDPGIPSPSSAVHWPRYGFATRPLHISDGTHGAGKTEAQAIAERLIGRPLTIEESHDLSLTYCGSTSARSTIIERYSTAGPCSWTSCVALPVELAQECLAGTRRCQGADFGPILCYWEASGGKITFNSARAECDPARIVVPPPPPPPPPPPEPPEPCGNGGVDEGETCITCARDMPLGACDEEPEPPGDDLLQVTIVGCPAGETPRLVPLPEGVPGLAVLRDRVAVPMSYFAVECQP